MTRLAGYLGNDDNDGNSEVFGQDRRVQGQQSVVIILAIFSLRGRCQDRCRLFGANSSLKALVRLLISLEETTLLLQVLVALLAAYVELLDVVGQDVGPFLERVHDGPGRAHAHDEGHDRVLKVALVQRELQETSARAIAIRYPNSELGRVCKQSTLSLNQLDTSWTRQVIQPTNRRQLRSRKTDSASKTDTQVKESVRGGSSEQRVVNQKVLVSSITRQKSSILLGEP